MDHESSFELAAASIRMGPGGAPAGGAGMPAPGGARVVLGPPEPGRRALPPVAAVLESLAAERIEASLFDRVRVEPTDGSFREAIGVARDGGFDALVAGGGGP